MTRLSDQIFTLNERMDELTSRIEELNSKFPLGKVYASQQNLALQSEACNGSTPQLLMAGGLSNGPMTGGLLPHSSSSSQLVKDSQVVEEVPDDLYLRISVSCTFVIYNLLICKTLSLLSTWI